MTYESEYKGEGWYTVHYSDCGMDYTDEGAIWIESEAAYNDMMESASSGESEYHIAYSEYHGDSILPAEDLDADAAINEWVDYDPYYLSDETNRLADELVDARNNGTTEDVKRAIDALKALD